MFIVQNNNNILTMKIYWGAAPLPNPPRKTGAAPGPASVTFSEVLYESRSSVFPYAEIAIVKYWFKC